jgi:hypothetical protein
MALNLSADRILTDSEAASEDLVEAYAYFASKHPALCIMVGLGVGSALFFESLGSASMNLPWGIGLSGVIGLAAAGATPVLLLLGGAAALTYDAFKLLSFMRS